MVVQSVEELRRRVQNGWRLTRDRKGFKMRGPGGRWERVSRELEQEAARLYAQQRAERSRGPSACDEMLREKEDECLDRLNECSNTYAPLLLKSLKLIALLDVLFDALAQGRLKGLSAWTKLVNSNHCNTTVHLPSITGLNATQEVVACQLKGR